MAKPSGKHVDRAADVLAIFGISGDLAKKMTFRALYRMERAGRLDCPGFGVAIDEGEDEGRVREGGAAEQLDGRVLGVAIHGGAAEALRQHAREAVTATIHHFDEEVF